LLGLNEMNVPVFKEGGGSNGYLGAALGAGLGILGSWALFTYQFENGKVWDQGQAIIKLQEDESSTLRDVSRLEGDVAATQANMNTILAQVGAMKSSSDAQIEAFHALQKKFDDLDSVLRPFHPGSH
jgi:hypothetical protein